MSFTSFGDKVQFFPFCRHIGVKFADADTAENTVTAAQYVVTVNFIFFYSQIKRKH